MPFSHSTLGYLTSGVQRRLQTYWNNLPDDLAYSWLYLFTPVYDYLTVEVVVALMIWFALSLLSLRWMRDHAHDYTCICNNLELRKKRAQRSHVADVMIQRLSNRPRRSASPPLSCDTSVDSLMQPSPVRNANSPQSPLGTYSDDLNRAFSLDANPGSGAFLVDMNDAGNRHMFQSNSAFFFASDSGSSSSPAPPSSRISANDSGLSSWLAPSAPSPWNVRESSTPMSSRTDDSNTAASRRESGMFQDHQVDVSPQYRLDGTHVSSGTGQPAVAASDLLPTNGKHDPPTNTASAACSKPVTLGPTPAQMHKFDPRVAPPTINLLHILASESDRSRILDESLVGLDSIVVPATPTPSGSNRHPVSHSKLVQPTLSPLSPQQIQILVTSAEQNESQGIPIIKAEPVELEMPIFPEAQMLSANIVVPTSLMPTPGRGRGPSFIALQATPLADDKTTVMLSLADASNVVQQEIRRRGQAPRGRPRTKTQVQTHIDRKPKWARSTPDANVSSQKDKNVAKPAKIEVEVKAEVKAEPVPVKLEPAPCDVKVKSPPIKQEPISFKLEHQEKVPNWALEAMKDEPATPGVSSSAKTKNDGDETSASSRKRKSRIVMENGRWKRGTWSPRGSFISARKS